MVFFCFFGNPRLRVFFGENKICFHGKATALFLLYLVKLETVLLEYYKESWDSFDFSKILLNFSLVIPGILKKLMAGKIFKFPAKNPLYNFAYFSS
jgi:hypothetical protein